VTTVKDLMWLVEVRLPEHSHWTSVLLLSVDMSSSIPCELFVT